MYEVLVSFATGTKSYRPGEIVESFDSEEMTNDLLQAGYIKPYSGGGGGGDVDLSEYVRHKPGSLEEEV